MNNKKRITTPPTTGQMILGWLMAALYLTVLPGAVVSLLKFLELELSALWMNLICWGAGSVLVILALWDFLFKNLKLLRKQFWQAFQAVILGYLLYAFTQGILNFLYESIAPEFTNINNSSISAMVLEEPLAMAVALMVLVPIVEECIYRGMIFAPLANGKYIVGLLLSAVAFAFSHVASYVGTYDVVTLTLCTIQYLPAGIALAWTFGKADTIWASIVLHAIINGISFTAIYFGA